MMATIASLICIVFVLGFTLQVVPILVWAERKVCARIQHRLGPNIVGPFGLLQPLADAIKLLTKEEVIPDGAERTMFRIAPLFAFIPAALALGAVPFGHAFEVDGVLVPIQVADLNVGVLFILAISSIGVYSLAFGGWAGNSKYPLLAAVRASAQTVSYEIAMGLAIIAAVMVSGSLNMGEIIEAQTGTFFGILPAWNIFRQPLAAMIFLVAMYAENNRLPFDLAECEPELVGGFHTEHSGMKFGVFFLGEYVAMILMSGTMVTLFFGGWTLPGVIDPTSTALPSALLSVLVFLAKIGLFLFLYIHVRWTLPRFRWDQLMHLGWKVLVPLGLLNILLTAIVELL